MFLKTLVNSPESIQQAGMQGVLDGINEGKDRYLRVSIRMVAWLRMKMDAIRKRTLIDRLIADERGDVPGWVLVVLMTTGLITAIWAIAEPRLSQLLRNSLDSMNTVR